MATVSSSREVTGVGNDTSRFTVNTDLNTETGELTTTIYSASGSNLLSGTPEYVMSRLKTIGEKGSPDAMATFASLSQVVGDQQSSLSSTYEKEKAKAATPPAEGTKDTTGKANDPKQNKANDDAANNSTTTAPAGTQPTSIPAGNVGGSQKENKPGTEGGANKLGTSDELPGRRVYNPLSTLTSYTYNLTLYMVNPDALNVFVLSGGKQAGDIQTTDGSKKKGFYIIAQSGGINNSTESRALTFSGEPGDSSGGYDYFIDDLTFETLTPAKDGSKTPTNSISFKFKITEPMGFNLLTDLTKCARKVMGESVVTKDSKVEKLPYQQHYMLGIRFYGYDANGQIVTSKDFAQSDSATASITPFSQNASTDNTAIFERFYPITINNVTFKIDGRAVVYTFDAVGASLQAAFGEKRGIVKKPTEFFASTVEEALLGMTVPGDPSAPFWATKNAGQASEADGREQPGADPRTANAQSANPNGNKQPKMNPKGGLLQVINSDLSDDELQGRREKAPRYFVQFDKDDKSIRGARLVNKDPQSAGGSGANRTSGSNAQASAQSNKAQTNGTRITVAGGTSIVQAIDDIISQSTFIDDAVNVVNNPNPEPNPENKTASKPLKWYSINPVVKVTALDNKTNDWVYDVCYQIQTYDIPYIRTNYKGVSSKYYGPHKRYEYWFTGKNTEILNYEQQFDALYYTVSTTSVGTDNSSNTDGAGASVSSAPQGGSDSRTNGPKTNRAGAVNQNVKAALYSTADQAKATIKIIGDPDYLFQTVLGSPSLTGVYSKRYGPGFTINPNGGQVFIEIQFNNAQDYNGGTGVVDVSDKVQFYPSTILQARGVKGLVYQVIQVTSSFSKGKFEQTLELLLVDERLLLSKEELEADRKAQAKANGERSSDTSAQSSKNPPSKKEDTKPAPKNLGGNNTDQNQTDAETKRLAAANAANTRTVETKTGQVADDDGNKK